MRKEEPRQSYSHTAPRGLGSNRQGPVVRGTTRPSQRPCPVCLQAGSCNVFYLLHLFLLCSPTLECEGIFQKVQPISLETK